MGVRVFRQEPSWNLEDIRLPYLLASVGSGDIQRPAFCRPWSWSGDDVVDLIGTVIQGGPIGKVTLATVEANASSSLSALPGTGQAAKANRSPSRWVVDGQQRLVALFGALVSSRPMRVVAEDDTVVHRLHYLDMRKVLDDQAPVRDAILPVRVLADGSPASPGEPDLREPARQFSGLLFPLNRMYDHEAWERGCITAWRATGGAASHEAETTCTGFWRGVVRTLERYQVPVQVFWRDATYGQLTDSYLRCNAHRLSGEGLGRQAA